MGRGRYVHVMNLQFSPGTTEEIPTGFPQSREECFLWLEIATVDETSPDMLGWCMALYREHYEAPCSGSLTTTYWSVFSASIRKPQMFHFLKVLVWKGFFGFFLCWFCFVLFFQWITKRLFTWPKHLCGSKGYEVLWCMGREPCNGGNSQCSICAMSPLPSCLKTMASEGLTSTVAGRRLRSKKETEHYMASGFSQLPCPDTMCSTSIPCALHQSQPHLSTEKPCFGSQSPQGRTRHTDNRHKVSPKKIPHCSPPQATEASLFPAARSLWQPWWQLIPFALSCYPPVLHLSMHLRKVLHPKGLFRLPGKFEPLINLLGQGDDGAELCFSLSVWAIVLKAQQRAVIWHAAP